jgi:hypothetical protein
MISVQTRSVNAHSGETADMSTAWPAELTPDDALHAIFPTRRGIIHAAMVTLVVPTTRQGDA